MKLLTDASLSLQSEDEVALTIGNFDGVHLGHKALIECLLQKAFENNAKSVVMSFSPHPQKVLFPEREHKSLFDTQDQASQFEKMGIDFFLLQNFDLTVAKLSPRDFLNNYIFARWKLKSIVVGYDFRFGFDRVGDHAFLKSECNKRSIELTIVPAHKNQDISISSSLIRDHIQKGEIKRANFYLGRKFYRRGKVIQGDQRGRVIGFPTANMLLTDQLTPKTGVYASEVVWQGRAYPSISNLGVRPTFMHGETKSQVVLETHIFAFDQMIYGEEIEVRFIDFIRDEVRFASVKELIQQIQKDIEKVREIKN